MSVSKFLVVVVSTLLGGAVCYAGVSAVVIVYQPIITAHEAVTIETPKGFSLMPIPFLSYHFQGQPPYQAITQPNQILTDAPRTILTGDANLLSSAGVAIGRDERTLYVRFENLSVPRAAAENLTEDDIAEAALECIRRMAQGAKNKPKLTISGRKGEEAKWQKWQKHFVEHDLSKPFSRPAS